MRTAKPELRITKYLRRIGRSGPRIPLEAECAACADAQFKIKYDKRSEWGCHGGIAPGAPPDYDRYVNRMQGEFGEHLRPVHPEFVATERRRQG